MGSRWGRGHTRRGTWRMWNQQPAVCYGWWEIRHKVSMEKNLQSIQQDYESLNQDQQCIVNNAVNSVNRNECRRRLSLLWWCGNKQMKCEKMQVGWVMVRFISTSRITKQIVTGVIGQWWGLFPSLARILNEVTYVLSCPSWRANHIVHVDKIKSVKTFPK